MNGFVNDFRTAWHKPNNGLVRLIIINVFVFIVLNLLFFISRLTNGTGEFMGIALDYITIPSEIEAFIFKPWTVLTYFFVHEQFFHILFNMLVLYWFGMIFDEYLGDRKLISLYILGGITGGLAFLILYNILPYFSERNTLLIGASGSVYAIVVGAATLVPEYRMHLLFFGPIRIKYIAAVYIFLSLISTAGSNAGGNIAHLGGALMGYLFVVQLRKGDDWSKPVLSVINAIESLFKLKSNMKVSHRKDSAYATTKATQKKKSFAAAGHSGEPDQAVVDAILDKISDSGYEKLTAEEKQILFKASQKKS